MNDRRAAAGQSGRGGVLELLLSLILIAAISGWSAWIQRPYRWDGARWGDGAKYLDLAGQFQNGERPHTEVPFVYRVGVPWLSAIVSPSDHRAGFFWINVVSGIACAVLLMLWLRRFDLPPPVRVLSLAMFCGAWVSPVRMVYFNALSPDPPYMVLICAGIMLIHAQSRGSSASRTLLLSLVCVLGTLAREAMVMIVPVANLFADNPLGAATGSPHGRPRMTAAARFAPLAAGAIAWAVTHVIAEPIGSRTYFGTVLQSLQEPPTSYALAWFGCFGPILAVVLYDWKATARFLREHEFLGVFLLVTSVLAYIGGKDTERFLSWLFPVVYLLIAVSLARLARLFDGVFVAGMALCQIVLTRLLWPVPLPNIDPPALLDTSGSGRVFGVLDRLFVIKHFHYNLYSTYGSRSFGLARLALFLAITGVTVMYLRFNTKKLELHPERSRPTY
ncbi:MAG TPA: hypothetical protein VN628_10795 [Vicinamibacterales bacterium]|nr:hypothetical protein [Vicinamibacterales bacterium]